MMPVRFLLLIGLLACAGTGYAQRRPTQANPDSLRVITTDITNFWRAYDKLATAASTPDSVAVVETQYLALATPGLRRYVQAANATAPDFLRAIRTHQRYLASIRQSTLAVNRYQPELVRVARKLKKVYPATVFPDVYFAIGKFEVGGTPFEELFYVGAELKCAAPDSPLAELVPDARGSVSPVAAISTVCIHEIVHIQQQLQNSKTNLEGALQEGAAEYVAFRLTGRLGSPAAFAYGRQHEQALRQSFAKEANQPLAAKWFLAKTDPVTHQPGALAYFIGFRICEAYYAQARDKKQALATIVALSNLDELRACANKYLNL